MADNPLLHLLCASLCRCCCLIQVTDEFKQGQWLIAGNVSAASTLPYGKLCGSKVFTYTATFGPFKNCGKKKVSTAQHSMA